MAEPTMEPRPIRVIVLMGMVMRTGPLFRRRSGPEMTYAVVANIQPTSASVNRPAPKTIIHVVDATGFLAGARKTITGLASTLTMTTPGIHASTFDENVSSSDCISSVSVWCRVQYTLHALSSWLRNFGARGAGRKAATRSCSRASRSHIDAYGDVARRNEWVAADRAREESSHYGSTCNTLE